MGRKRTLQQVRNRPQPDFPRLTASGRWRGFFYIQDCTMSFIRFLFTKLLRKRTKAIDDSTVVEARTEASAAAVEERNRPTIDRVKTMAIPDALFAIAEHNQWLPMPERISPIEVFRDLSPETVNQWSSAANSLLNPMTCILHFTKIAATLRKFAARLLQSIQASAIQPIRGPSCTHR